MGTFHQQIGANALGRDFVVGDLHGCLQLLQAALARLEFDPTQDRLFSVGDLIDRGPDSFGCLRLLREPWFFAVIGNHEDMLLSYFRQRDSTYHSPSDLLRNGGRWVQDLNKQEADELTNDLVPRLLTLPYVITVGDGAGKFHVAHAELMTGHVEEGLWLALQGLPVNGNSKRLLNDKTITDKVLSNMVASLTWGRRLVKGIKTELSTEIDTPIGTLRLSGQPRSPGLSLTYVGHTVMQTMALHRSHLFIDRGAYAGILETQLLVLKHQDVLKALAKI